ncbi:short-chain dehydrogenase [Azorhizobium caulinodans ORS 571]|uniref:Short-chain dehydrogenase n=1 Tax=Azorhizobium caulinodans (strain ATCC 43989 / DSM 5975 / JCM 20966 / LMG 6465 / NBRC 14845 / NCIMB 13405 / ORS 571) TaxID=438753 RepID=A8IQ20_AZOC5|nr:SDR family oxidoreductase [Azorhizobium caulinodans]BAF86730.1 short-chain dehydrogenase [Azorhizobium caulinodans ORS 571]
MPRHALVTGASRGIGRATALRLARDGFAVSVGYAGQAIKAQEVVAEITAAGGQAIALQADIAKAADVDRMFGDAESAFGPVNVVVNSAGVLKMVSMAKASDADLAAILATNVTGAFNVLRAAANRVPDGGRIISLSTTVVATAFPNYGLYSASKAAVDLFTRTLANELRGRNICVNAVAPGPTGTELFFEGKSEELVERLAKAPPLERIATPEEIAAVIAFLAGPDGGWVNGQIVRANGGLA